MTPGPTNIALLYDTGAYVETLRATAASSEGPAGLMGRQVAGKEFLDAYFHHGSWTELVGVVRDRANADSLVQLCRTHPSSRAKKRRLRIVEEREFHARFVADPPAPLLYMPGPLDARFAWARWPSNSFGLCGVTHTLCSAPVLQHLRELVTAPYEPWDALICTSQAVVDMVRAVTGAYADYLRDRHGGSPQVPVRLELIPLGVDVEKFRPPTPAERAARRKAFDVHDDEVAVLFVGRLSHHGKAHPFPMFRALAQAARRADKKVHLLLAGWAAHPAVQRGFVDGARLFAPNVRTTVLDGTRADVRFGVWHAADVFTSLSDNIQETFGLVIVEAMASGLPVVASDWNGYRDIVAPGETGVLIPTHMVGDATSRTTSRLLFGEINYDQFLAECSQAVAVDLPAAVDAYAGLLSDASLRARMGAAGRDRALQRYAWPHIIRAYEALWRTQESMRQSAQLRMPTATLAAYPAPELSFAGYPTAWLGEADRLMTTDDARAELETFLRVPLTNHAAERRVSDAAILRSVLAAAISPCPLADLDAVFERAGVERVTARATLAWMLKYGLLQRVPAEEKP